MKPFVLSSYRGLITSLTVTGFCMPLLAACMAAPTDPAPTDEKIDLTQEPSVHPETAPLNTATGAPEHDHPAATATPPEEFKPVSIDVGDRDEYAWIPEGCTYYADQLTAAGIPHELRTYDGRHQDQLASRIRQHMLPFFSGLLER